MKNKLPSQPPLTAALLSSALVLTACNNSPEEPTEVSYDNFVSMLATDGEEVQQISHVFVEDDIAIGEVRNGQMSTLQYKTVLPPDENLSWIAMDENLNVSISYAEPHEPNIAQQFIQGAWQDIRGWWPVLPLFIILAYTAKRLDETKDSPEKQKKDEAKDSSEKQKKENVTFDDVAGIDEAKAELMEIVDSIKNPEKYRNMGASLPKGYILKSPPGAGKTFLARALANEADAEFFAISGADIDGIYVGEGAKRIRKLFEKAQQCERAIIFIDEIDSLGRKRSSNTASPSWEGQTLNSFLVQLDGFDRHDNITVIGATNRYELLDSALIRPGRLEKTIHVPYPNKKGRKEILEVHARRENIRIAPEGINFKSIAKHCENFSPAGLAALVKEAAMCAVREDADFVTTSHFETAIERVTLGTEIVSDLSKKEIEEIAFYRAGQEIVRAGTTKNYDFSRVSIWPRGETSFLIDEEESYSARNITKTTLINKLAVLLAGQAAQRIGLGADSLGTIAAKDLKDANDLAKKMVYDWKLHSSEQRTPSINLPDDLLESFNISQESQVAAFLKQAQDKATDILHNYQDELNDLAKTLSDQKTLQPQEVKDLLASMKRKTTGPMIEGDGTTAVASNSSNPWARPE